jgi:hypothetical protein
MVVAVLAALVVGWWVESGRRRSRFAALAFMHLFHRSDDPSGRHAQLFAKYIWAADHPWLPVWPDPPELE